MGALKERKGILNSRSVAKNLLLCFLRSASPQDLVSIWWRRDLWQGRCVKDEQDASDSECFNRCRWISTASQQLWAGRMQCNPFFSRSTVKRKIRSITPKLPQMQQWSSILVRAQHRLHVWCVSVIAPATQSPPQHISRVSIFPGCRSTAEQLSREQIARDRKSGAEALFFKTFTVLAYCISMCYTNNICS